MAEKQTIDAMWDDSPVDVSTEVNFIWSIANKLRGTYQSDKYKDVIIPMVIIRRFECALAPTKQKVVDLAKLVARYSGPIPLHVVNFTDIQLYIYEQCPHEELTIIMRRYMMKLAEHFAKENKCLGLITGESIGQVASQTMQSLAATNEVCTMPVYRPLIGFDKQKSMHMRHPFFHTKTAVPFLWQNIR